MGLEEMREDLKRIGKFEQQETLTYEYHEALTAVLKDLEILDKLIPRESSRHSHLVHKKFGRDAPFIIEGRRTYLLSYIQTICRDHLCFGGELLKRGWIVKGRKTVKAKKKADNRRNRSA